MQEIYFTYQQKRVNIPAENKRITFEQLRQIIQQGPPADLKQAWQNIPELARRKYQQNIPGADTELSAEKVKFPWLMLSGWCPYFHSADGLKELNGCIQLDYDLKQSDGDAKALEILQRIKEVKPAGVLFANLSPSTFGNKIILATDCLDPDRFKDVQQAGIDYVSQLLDLDPVKFDILPLAQTCFVPYERQPGQAYFNEQAGVVNIHLPERKSRQQAAVRYPAKIVLASVNYMIENSLDPLFGAAPNTGNRNEYVRIIGACIFEFGEHDGKQKAWDLLQNSPAFLASNFERKFNKAIKGLSRQSGKVTTGATLVWIAQKHGFRPEHCDQGKKTVINADQGAYLTDVLDLEKIPLDAILGKRIVSPTGSGKTSMVAAFIRRYPERKAVLILPQLATIQQEVESHSDIATPFTGNSRRITGTERFYITTIPSLAALGTRVNLSEFDLFFDEAHGLTADASPGYKLEDLRRLMRMAQDAKSITYLTGTPLFSFDPRLADLETLEIRQKPKVKKTAYFYDCENILAAAAAMMERSKKAGHVPILLLNDKKLKLAEVEAALKDYGLDLLILNSDRKTDPDFIHLAKHSEIPAGKTAIITTSVLREGNNIKDGRHIDFFIIGNHHSSTIQQITSRPRTAEKVDVHLLRSKNRKTADRSGFSTWRLAKRYEQEAQRICDEINSPDRLQDDSVNTYCEHLLRRAVQTDPIYTDSEGRAQICWLHLANMVYQEQARAEYQDDKLLAAALRRYGFEIYGGHVAEYTGADVLTTGISVAYDGEQKLAIKAAKAHRKEAAKEAHQGALDALQAAISPAAMIRQAEQAGAVPAAFKWVKHLHEKFGINHRAGIDLLRNIESGKQFTLLCRRIAANLLESNKAYLAQATMTGILLMAIRKKFKAGTKHTAEHLREMVADVLKIDKSIRIDDWRPDPGDPQAIERANRRAIEFLRVFFEVEKSEFSGNRCSRKWSFSLNKIAFFGNTKNTISSCKSIVYSQKEAEKLESAVFATFESEDCPF